jgi:Holliday junction resolvase RusA-like endonuclease
MKKYEKSIGQTSENEGTDRVVDCEKIRIDYDRHFFILDIIPNTAPRMTRSDQWKTDPNHPNPKQRQRLSVTRYFAYKNSVAKLCNEINLNEFSTLDIIFFIPMPQSWSKKKKEKMNGMPHQSRPDIDNLSKAFMDSVMKEDSHVWSIRKEKRWAYFGSILIYV